MTEAGVSDPLKVSMEAQYNKENAALSDEDDFNENELDDKFLSFRELKAGLLRTMARIETDTQFLHNNINLIREKLYTPYRRTASLDILSEFHEDLANDFRNVPELLEEEKNRIASISEVQNNVEFLQTSKLQYLNDSRTSMIGIRNNLCATKLSSRSRMNMDESIMNTTHES